MIEFIDLARRFRDLTRDELEEPELLASMNERDLLPVGGWPELLKHPRIVILAEAGSGKSAEMREQAGRLARQGKFAFFVALETLDRETLASTMSADEEQAFKFWKTNGHSPAWFFLDSVDELKLTQGKLDRALGRFAKEIDGHLDRARLVISCRPSDWRPRLDLATVQERVPIVSKQPKTMAASEEMFLAALRLEGPGDGAEEENEEAPIDKVRTVFMLPLGAQQIQHFVHSCGLKDAAAFLAELDKRDAWTFARRPLDLSDLVATWTTTGRLGTRAEQHEANIATKLNDDPDRPDLGVLSEARARLGAERLALALALTRTRTIRVPEQTVDHQRHEGVLDAAQVLPDWSEAERQALLRRALFDPATYGRVRFHHRSVQEYLAAALLWRLRKKDMATKAMRPWLFANGYGVDIVVPSMREIAAWLAVWDESVRREVIAREPEVLLSLGDPESLPIEARGKLIRAFAGTYGAGGSRGIRVPLEEVRRLAHPELAEIVRELWSSGPANNEVAKLLLDIIWQGPIESCADIAQSVAMSEVLPDRHRVAAIRAMLSMDRHSEVRCLAEAMLSEHGTWSIRLVSDVAPGLFPHVISAVELVSLIERNGKATRRAEEFAWPLEQLIRELDPVADYAVELRDALADLIWRGRDAKCKRYDISSKYDAIAPALAQLCSQQLALEREHVEPALVYACVIATRFGTKLARLSDIDNQLRGHFCGCPPLREAAFWNDLVILDELTPSDSDLERLFNVEEGSLLGKLQESDRPWLESSLMSADFPQRKPIALHALINLWRRRGALEAELEELRRAIGGELGLLAIFTHRTAAQKPTAQRERFEREQDQRAKLKTLRENRRIRDWRRWRKELLMNPELAFSKEHQPVTIRNLFNWLKARGDRSSHYDVWDHDTLSQAFGEDIASRAREAFQAFWRSQAPVLWSDRPPEQRNSIPYNWIYGLCGVYAEAVSPGWAAALNAEEVRLATVYATIELNGFAPWIRDLVRLRATEVEAVLGKELDAELAVGGDHDYLRVLQDLSHADFSVKCLLAPRLLARLPTLGTAADDIAANRWAVHFERVVRVLEEATVGEDRLEFARECERRFASAPTKPVARAWLQGIFHLDMERGAHVLEKAIAGLDVSERPTLAVKSLAALFGDDRGELPEIIDPSRRSATLCRLVRCAYTYVRPADDKKHEGSYTPNARDHAESARMFLMTALQETPGPSTYRALIELAADPLFADISDRLRLAARQRAARDAEFAPLTPADVVALETLLEVPPHDRDGLYAVMSKRPMIHAAFWLDAFAWPVGRHRHGSNSSIRLMG